MRISFHSKRTSPFTRVIGVGLLMIVAQSARAQSPTPTATSTPTPGPINPNNILVAHGTEGESSSVQEFTPAGELVQTIFFNYNNGSYPVSELLRDIIVDQDGSIAGYNGTFYPLLTRYSSISKTFTHTTFAGWTCVNGDLLGGIAAYQNFVYVTDMRTGLGVDLLEGIVRFDTATHTAIRFAEDTEFISLNIGLDGELYALPSSTEPIKVYNPLTMAFLRQIPLPTSIINSGGIRNVAVDRAGRLFVAGNTVYRLSSSGTIEVSKSTGFDNLGLSDISVDENGRLIVTHSYGRVSLGDTTLVNDFTGFWLDGAPNPFLFAIFACFAHPLPAAFPPGATPTPTPSPSSTQALNISTRLWVDTGSNVLIGGFIVAGPAPKHVAVRGIGPSLAQFGITDALADPTLELHASNGSLLAQDDDWQDDTAHAAQLTALGLALSNPKESGIVATLQPGAYTAILGGKNETTGVGLVEIYDTNPGVNSQLANISTRGFVQGGNNVMIGGFILGGNNHNTRVVVRGIGPSLAQFGLSPVLADPTLELHDSNGAVLVSNDDWQDDPASASQLSFLGLAPSDPKESAIFRSLPPGGFTAILAGKDGGIGIGLVEVYNVH